MANRGVVTKLLGMVLVVLLLGLSVQTVKADNECVGEVECCAEWGWGPGTCQGGYPSGTCNSWTPWPCVCVQPWVCISQEDGYCHYYEEDNTCRPMCQAGAHDPTGWCQVNCVVSSPNPISLNSPASGHSFSHTGTVQLSWNAVSSWGTGCPSNNNRYRLCIGTNNSAPCGSAVVDTWLPSATTSYLFDPPGPGTYYWKVHAHNGSSETISSHRSLIVTNSAPSCSLNLNPVTITRGGSATITMTVSDADGASDISQVWMGASNCSVDPGTGNNSNFERNFANYFGYSRVSYPVSISAASNNSGAACNTSGQGGANPFSGLSNASGTAVLQSQSAVNSGNNKTVTYRINTSSGFPLGYLNYYCMAKDNQNIYQNGTTTPNWKRMNSVCVNNGETCANRCGQTTGCGNCSSADSGIPGQPGLVSPIGSIGSPVTSTNNAFVLDWNQESNHGFTDYYQYQVFRVAGNGATSSVSTLTQNNPSTTQGSYTVGAGNSGVRYGWQVRAVNNTCQSYGPGLQPGQWSGRGYFCYETETCALSCGQNRDCPGAAACSGASAGVPGAPMARFPMGTVDNPMVIPVNTSSGTTTVQWFTETVNHSLTDGYRVQLINADTGATLMNTLGTNPNEISRSINWSTGVRYGWQVRAENNTCDLLGINGTGAWSGWNYFRFNRGPSYVSSQLLNHEGTIVGMQNTGTGVSGNQICQVEFDEARQAAFRVTVADPDGDQDIDTIRLRLYHPVSGQTHMTATVNDMAGMPSADLIGTGVGWDGTVTLSSLGAGTSRVVTIPVDFLNNFSSSDLNRIDVEVEDQSGVATGWVPTNRYFKVWDCNVNVSGTIYDGSAGRVCQTNGSGTGFDVPIPMSIQFSSLDYLGVGGAADRDMYEVPPSSYHDNDEDARKLVWRESYLAEFNSDMEADDDIRLRMVDMGSGGVGTTFCPSLMEVDIGASNSLGQFLVSPYAIEPEVRIDYSLVLNQEPWFQVAGGNVYAQTTLVNAIPVTCQRPGCNPDIAVANGADTAGFVAAGNNIDTNSGCSLGCGSGECCVSYPSNSSIIRDLVSPVMGQNYDYFYREYVTNLGIGRTYSGATNLSTIVADMAGVGGSGVVFVSGSLTADVANTVPVGSYLMVVVSGNITILEGVNRVEGILVADGVILTNPAAGNIQLVISGILKAGGTANLGRGFADSTLNNDNPGVRVEYRPDFIFALPGTLIKSVQNWRESAN